MSVDVFTATGLDGRASYAPATTERLWAQVPAELRLVRYAPETVAAEHRPAFAAGARLRRWILRRCRSGCAASWRGR